MKEESFKSLIAVLTAFVTVLGASAACLASSAASKAADADFAGLDTSIRAQKAEIINHVYAYEHYRAFTEYTRFNELGYLLYDPNADEATNILNALLQREVWGLADGLMGTFFSPRYVNPDGQYELDRELQSEFAKDQENENLNPAPYFEESDRQREKSSDLAGNMILFAVSFWFLTLAQAAEKKIKYLWAVMGILLGLTGTIAVIINGLR